MENSINSMKSLLMGVKTLLNDFICFLIKLKSINRIENSINRMKSILIEKEILSIE